MKQKRLILVIFSVITMTIFLLSLVSSNNSEIKLYELNDLDILYSDNTDIYVYFGRPTCQNCNKFYEQIKNNNSELPNKIYYFNTDKWRNDGITEIICRKYKVDSVPSLKRIRNGECIDTIDISSFIK